MVQSFLFRLIIIMYSVWITVHDGNSYDLLTLTAIIFVYLAIYIIAKFKENDVFRLIWDFVFINIIVYNKDVYNPMVFMLVILPMINAINYTGHKTHRVLLMFLTIVTLLLCEKSFDSWIIIPIISLYIMYVFAIRRYREWEIDQSLTKSVDSYFTDSSMLKPHQIYACIIKDLNNYFGLKDNEGIQQMGTYTLKGDTLWLVNASNFLWNRTLDLDVENLTNLKEKGELKLINENTVTYFFYIPMEGIEYVFTCVTHNVSDLMLMFYRFKKIIKLAFMKMSTLLITEYRISERREEKFNEIKDNVLYVNQAVKTMHFIRNKLNPLSNLIAYHIEVENMPQEVKNKMHKAFEREVKQASRDLNDILNFANYLLDKSKNPFHGTEVSEISLFKIYIILSEIAERYIGEIIEVDESVKSIENEKLFIKTNIIECKIMFIDWINNMRKYSDGEDLISMKVDNDNLIVHFENKLKKNENDISYLINDMNSRGKEAVLEGKDYGYGIYIIKSIANEFNVGLHANKQCRDNNTYLTLDFNFTIYGNKKNSHL